MTCPTCGLLQPPSDKCEGAGCESSLKDVISPIKGLRFHDLRHHAITELAESQTSDSTIMAIAGHVSQKMLAHYSHVRLQAKRTALDALSMKRPPRAMPKSETTGHVTNHVTNQEKGPEQVAQVLEKMVELVGIEPTTSSLRMMGSAILPQYPCGSQSRLRSKTFQWPHFRFAGRVASTVFPALRSARASARADRTLSSPQNAPRDAQHRATLRICRHGEPNLC